jgi:hypothetical protein
MMDAALTNAIRRLVSDLASGAFREVVADGRAGRLTAAELEAAVRTYGRTLVPLPDDAFALVETYELSGDPNALAVDVPLWTIEEGRSDLTLSLTALRRGSAYDVQVDDLHVL